ncbi:hypothetical protein EDB81DRAFT_888405 [Dactylonectria macrodidyma]|uniref:Uncharacterized protein n=1 Tax=Dactylonectria macrodidyma TaxID=307937 RepID=A0A9P9E5U1_9HYPO|nr:hypothetical protein EDB81DRAFT_888405 [Dactylonectria macrodidyma]
MSPETSNEALKVKSMPQGDRQDAAGTCGGPPLLCPIHSAYPNLHTGTKTCDNNCKDIRRVKDHLKKRHRCDCPGRPANCQNLLHVGPTKLKELSTIRRLPGETPGEQWARIYKIICPGQKEILAPYVPSASDLKAIARAPPPGFVKKLAKSLQDAKHGDIDGIHLLLAQVPLFIDLVCQGGAYPDSHSTVHHTSSNTRVSATHNSMHGSGAAEHQEPMEDDVDWDKFVMSPDGTW